MIADDTPTPLTLTDYEKGGDRSLTTAPPGLFIRVTVDGNTVKLAITNMFRGDGMQTVEPNDAVRVVAQLPDGLWGIFTVLPGDIETVKPETLQ